jgi:oligoribonuclease NrnB/cAMP/cGMP phosphodiesterase (DHH superfamily)
MLTEKEVIRLREELESSQHPLFFFHDDPDGLASYLMCQRFTPDGRGIVVKAQPHITTMFLSKVQEICPDKVFVLDIALVDQEFIDGCPVPVVWVDHHDPQDRDKVAYFNPRRHNVNVPASALIYQVTQKDIWLATVGCISDWYLPEFAKDFSAQYPDLLPPTVNKIETALFDTPLAKLIKAFSFLLKGPTSEVNKSIKIMTRIEGPYEILRQETSRGKLIYKKYEEINELYTQMLDKAFSKLDGKDKMLVYTYVDDKLSLTKDLANELLYRYADHIIILGRERHGEVRFSLRSPAGINLKPALEKALIGIEGYGGGHENACGAAVKKEDFPRFLENLHKELGL